MKLKCYQLKHILNINGFVSGFEIFKSGKNVILHIFFNEDSILDFVHENGFSITPKTIPTNGYYTIEFKGN